MTKIFRVALGLLMLSSLSCEKNDVQQVETIKIGALNSITGNWYGGDGIVQSAVLLSDAEASDFAVKVGFFAPNFGLPAQAHPDLSRISSSILAKMAIEPDVYALSAYDAVRIIALTIDDVPGVLQDFSTMKTVFTETSYRYFGITGPTMLDENGDRKIGTFDYWGIVNENGTYKWKMVGKSS